VGVVIDLRKRRRRRILTVSLLCYGNG